MDQAENLRNIVKSSQTATPIRVMEKTRVITVTSGKGGVGKSNLSVNLAIQLRRAGKRVIILDADFGLSNVEVMFGTIPKYTLKDMLYGGMSIKDIITTGPMGVGFISGGSGIIGLNNLTYDQLARLLSNITYLNELADVIIIDTGAGVSDQVMEFVLGSPEVLLVTTPEPSSLTDSYSLMKAMYKSPKFTPGINTVHLIANKVNSEAEGMAVYNKISSVVGQFLGGTIDYVGAIPNDSVLEKCVRSQQVVSIEEPNAKSSKAFMAVAERLFNTSMVNQPAPKWGIGALFGGILGKSGRRY